MSKLTEQQKALNAILSSNGFDFVDAFEVEEWHKDEDDISEKLQDRISEQEIIYYGRAIEYLAENDSSLMECMELAADMGYETKNLNSELLATILYQHNLSQKIDDVIKELEAFEFKELAS